MKRDRLDQRQPLLSTLLAAVMAVGFAFVLAEWLASGWPA